jgi:hypothetical protein
MEVGTPIHHGRIDRVEATEQEAMAEMGEIRTVGKKMKYRITTEYQGTQLTHKFEQCPTKAQLLQEAERRYSAYPLESEQEIVGSTMVHL